MRISPTLAMLLAIAGCNQSQSDPTTLQLPASTVIRIQFEDFNAGGQGVGYNDNEPGNLGGLYRPNEGVDIEQRADPDGYNIGWMVEGEWQHGDIKVPATLVY
jgi:hypothetical protein